MMVEIKLPARIPWGQVVEIDSARLPMLEAALESQIDSHDGGVSLVQVEFPVPAGLPRHGEVTLDEARALLEQVQMVVNPLSPKTDMGHPPAPGKK